MEPLSHWELSPDLARAMMREHNLWQTPLEDICSKATEIRVKDIMYTPVEGEYVEENTSLEEAIHQLVIGHHQSLLVTRDQAVVGILRLTDLFKEISIIINTCEITSYKNKKKFRLIIPSSSMGEGQEVNV